MFVYGLRLVLPAGLAAPLSRISPFPLIPPSPSWPPTSLLLASNSRGKSARCRFLFPFHSLSSFSCPFSLRSVCNIYVVGTSGVCRHFGITVTGSLAWHGLGRVTPLTGELKLLGRQTSDRQKGNVGAPAWKPTPEADGLEGTSLPSGFKSLLSIWVLLSPWEAAGLILCHTE